MTFHNPDHTLEKILQSIDLTRSIILDSVEQEITDLHSWKHLRARLLRALGESGLEGRLRTILSQALTNAQQMQIGNRKT
jgi:hypothetical protein